MDIPLPLLDDIASGKCVPFVGAGFSLNAQLAQKLAMPAWAELTAILAERCGLEEKANGPAVASLYEKRFGRVQLIEAIRKALHVDHAKPGKSHIALAVLPFDTVYTTNFDLLLEDSYTQIQKPFRSLVGELQMPFHGGTLTTSIIKMHGDLRHEEHIIVTKEDYAEYLTSYPVIATHLSSMLITRTPLFIGYSLSDPDFNHIREVVRSRLGKFARMSYVIQFDVPSDKAEEMLEDNLHVISVKTTSSDSRDSLLADIFTSIQEGLDSSQAVRFRSARPEAFEPIDNATLEAASKTSDASTLFTSSSNLCFVMMPFSQEFDAVYGQMIKPAAEHFALNVVRADTIYSPGSIMEQIRVAIQQSRLCIADLSIGIPMFRTKLQSHIR